MENINEDKRRRKDTECGCCGLRPRCLQVFANIGMFTAVNSVASLLTSTLQAYIGSQIPSIERQFGLSSYQSGLIMSFNEIGFVVCCLFVTSLARYVHIPRFLFFCFTLFGIAGIVCAVPHFFDPAREDVFGEMESFNSSYMSNLTGPSNVKMKPKMSSISLCTDVSAGSLNSTSCKVMSDSGDKEFISSGGVRTAALGIIALGMILQGMTKAPRTPFTAVYIDDNVDRRKTGFYVGIAASIALLGSALAYGLGGLFSKMHVSLKEVAITPRDPRWIGAWWLGFLSFGVATIVLSFPMVCLPRRLKSADRTLGLRESLATEKNMKKKDKFKDRLLSYYRILRNPLFLLICLATCSQALSFIGYLSFLTKYTSLEWNIPVWQANLIVGSTNLVSLAGGTMIGGVLTRKLRMTPRTTFVGIFVLFIIHTAVFCFGFFLGCDQPDIIQNPRYNSSSMPVKTSVNSTVGCAADCQCEGSTFFPVCGSDDLTYFNPCYAGCTESTMSASRFTNCSCVVGSKAIPGMCKFGCSTLIPWAVMNFISTFVGSVNIMFGFIAILRCVKDKDKSTSTGLQAFLMSLLAFMPAPIFFGKIFDSTCLLWSTTCEKKGACILYDIGDLRFRIHLYSLVFKLVAIAATGCAGLWTRKWRDWRYFQIYDREEEVREYFQDPDFM